MREKVINILKYFYDNQDVWIYSVEDKDNDNNILYRYYTMFFKDKKPIILDLENPIETLQNINIKPIEVREGSKDYIVFMAYKDVAEKNIISKIKK